MTSGRPPRTRVLAAVERLRALTEEQIAAARTLRSADLAVLNGHRADALFDLRIALQENGVPSDREDQVLRDAVRGLALAERRLNHIATAVLDRIACFDAGSPAPTYDRTGRLG
ncbi:MAG: hypothetical protein R3F59_25210 [Myxococcota bacterium]